MSISSSPHRVHALIIGIDTYSFDRTGFSPLRSAVSDAKKFCEWVVKDLKVPRSSIHMLLDDEATRENIIQALKDLANDELIEHDDPIIFYFAGHGSEAPAPEDWHWGHTNIQMIIPWDCRPSVDPNSAVHGIPDRTLGHLLTEMANGNNGNTTVIFDCCHSGSGTRSDEGDSQTRGGDYMGKLPADLDKNILSESSNGNRGVSVPHNFRHHGLRSHILLAACAPHEVAREEKEAGHFTRVLLKALSGVSTTEITYEDLLQRMDKLVNQTPQCEGPLRSRYLFDKKVPNTKAIHQVVLNRKADEATIGAGAIHGVELGTMFGLWKSQADVQGSPDAKVEVTATSVVRADKSTVTFRPGPDIVEPMVAQILGVPNPKLCIYVAPEVKKLECYKIAFSNLNGRGLPPVTVVDTKHLATIGLYIPDSDACFIGFEMLDPIAKEAIQKQRIRHVIPPDAANLQDALSHIAAYYHHKDRVNLRPQAVGEVNEVEPFSSKFTVDVFVLEWVSRSRQWVPKGHNRNVQGTGVKVTVCEQTKDDYYGFTVNNHTDTDVFVYLFYFDSSDFSITEIHKPMAVAQSDHIAPLEKGSFLTIGHGKSAVGPQVLEISDPEADFEMGYLRCFVSATYVDLSSIVQGVIPTSAARGMRDAPKASTPLWDCITVPIIMERSPLKPPEHMVGIIGSKGNGKHTFLAEFFKSIVGNQSPKPSFKNAYVKEYSIDVPERSPFAVVDLPSFEDSEDINGRIAVVQATLSYLTKEYQHGRRFRSFIWCYNISTPMSEVDRANLKLVMDLCGDGKFKNVVVVTTNWNRGVAVGLSKPASRGSIAGVLSPVEQYERNEQQLLEDPELQKLLREGRVRLERFGVFQDLSIHDHHPATEKIKSPSELLKLLLEKSPQPLLAQEEACNTKTVTKTTAGRTLQTIIQKEIDSIRSLGDEDRKKEDIVRWEERLEDLGSVNSVYH